jgi:hypothetical protein
VVWNNYRHYCICYQLSGTDRGVYHDLWWEIYWSTAIIRNSCEWYRNTDNWWWLYRLILTFRSRCKT